MELKLNNDCVRYFIEDDWVEAMERQ